MSTIFISDLHLDPGRPNITQQFISLTEQARNSEALYILGDFVEYWIGDDDTEHGLNPAFKALRTLAGHGTPVYLMHGNRDFLIGSNFAERYKVQLIEDPHIINLYGTQTLLMHGDTLCTDDTEYQSFRKTVRTMQWKNDFLSKPINERRNIVTGLRETSRQATGDKANDIMDVNQLAVLTEMENHKVNQLIHGHTHRPKIHHFTINNERAKRIVLGDWHQSAHILNFSPDEFKLQSIDFNTASLADLD